MVYIIKIAPGDRLVALVTINERDQLIRHHRLNRLAGDNAINFNEAFRLVYIRFWRWCSGINFYCIAGSLRCLVFQKVLRHSFALVVNYQTQIFEYRLHANPRPIKLALTANKVKIKINGKSVRSEERRVGK